MPSGRFRPCLAQPWRLTLIRRLSIEIGIHGLLALELQASPPFPLRRPKTRACIARSAKCDNLCTLSRPPGQSHAPAQTSERRVRLSSRSCGQPALRSSWRQNGAQGRAERAGVGAARGAARPMGRHSRRGPARGEALGAGGGKGWDTEPPSPATGNGRRSSHTDVAVPRTA